MFDTPGNSNCTFYIDPNHGNDKNNGSINSPLLTIERGINMTRKTRISSLNTTNRSTKNGDMDIEYCYLNLRNGIFYVNKTIELNAIDSYLIIENYNGENVTISGGIPLIYNKTDWKLVEYQDYDWIIYPNYTNCYERNNFNKSNDLVDFIGVYTSLDDCKNNVIESNSNKYNNYSYYKSFCYYSYSYSSDSTNEYKGDCYGVKDYSWQPYYQEGTISGQFEGRNIWSVEVLNNDIDDVPGLRLSINI